MMAPEDIFVDLIKTTPGEEGKWFATAKELELCWFTEGWGYEGTGVDVIEAHDRTMDAATRLNKADDVAERIRQLVEANDNSGAQNVARQLVRQALQGRVRDYGDDNSPVASDGSLFGY